MNRNVNVIQSEDNIYYFTNDFVSASVLLTNFQLVKLNINGNGSLTNSTFAQVGHLYRWTYPCGSSNWSLTAHVAAFK